MCCLAYWPVIGTAGCKEYPGAQPWGATPVRHGAQSATLPRQETGTSQPTLVFCCLHLPSKQPWPCLAPCFSAWRWVRWFRAHTQVAPSPRRAQQARGCWDDTWRACTCLPKRQQGCHLRSAAATVAAAGRSIHSSPLQGQGQGQGQAQSNDPRSWVQSGTPQEVGRRGWRLGARARPTVG